MRDDPYATIIEQQQNPPQLVNPDDPYAGIIAQNPPIGKQGQTPPAGIRAPPSPDMSASDRVKDIGQYYGEGGLLAADAATFGLGNRGVAVARGLGDTYRSGGASPFDHYGQYVAEQNQYLDKLRAADPARSVGADVVGGMGVGGGLAKAGITLMKPAVGWVERGIRGALEGGWQGGAQTAGQNYGTPTEKVVAGGMGTVLGGALGGAVPVAGSATRGAKSVLKGATGIEDAFPVPVLRAAEADRQALRRLPEGGMLTDTPSMQGLAQGAFVTKGPGSNKLEANLRARDAATGERLTATRQSLLGEAIEPAEYAAANKELRRTLRPEYEAAYRNARGVDTEGVANWLEGISVGKRGAVQTEAEKLRNALNVKGTKELDPDPNTLHSTREMIDDILYDPKGPPPPGVASMLKEARDRITAELHDKVPGIANIDAKYAEFASRQTAYDKGRTALDIGKEAVPPRTFAAEDTRLGQPKGTEAATVQGPSAAPLASRAGTTYDIDRLLGTTTNDLQQLKGMFQKEYNVKKFETQYGVDARKAMQDAIDNNITFREAYQKIVHGSKTAQTMEAAKEAADIPFPTSVTSAAVDMYNRMRAGTSANQRNRISEIMATQGADLPALRDSILQAAAEQRRADIARTMMERSATTGGAGAEPDILGRGKRRR